MDKKKLIELIIASIMVISGIVVITLPLFNVIDAKPVLIITLGLYGVLNLYKYISTCKSKDYDGLFTMFASLIVLGIMHFIDVNEAPFKLAFVLFIWIILLSIIKLIKSDYYHDRHNKEWIVKVVTLGLFIITGILASINLYNVDNQVLVLGFFIFINGILELIDPLSLYVIEKN